MQEHFGLKSSICMGHSMGGGVCSLFASTFPECVDRLIMLDFVAFGEGRIVFLRNAHNMFENWLIIILNQKSNVKSNE